MACSRQTHPDDPRLSLRLNLFSWGMEVCPPRHLPRPQRRELLPDVSECSGDLAHTAAMPRKFATTIKSRTRRFAHRSRSLWVAPGLTPMASFRTYPSFNPSTHGLFPNNSSPKYFTAPCHAPSVCGIHFGSKWYKAGLESENKILSDLLYSSKKALKKGGGLILVFKKPFIPLRRIKVLEESRLGVISRGANAVHQRRDGRELYAQIPVMQSILQASHFFSMAKTPYFHKPSV